MADVASRSGERGQLLLVAAIGLAVLFVMLALILNTAIYAEAIATQHDASQHERGAIEYQESVHRGVSGSIARVNAQNDSSYESLDANLSTQVDEWSESARRHAAVDGASASASLVDTTNGTRIVHDGSQFTDRDGAANWTPVESVSNVRAVRMNVTADSLYEAADGSCTESDGCFYVEVEDGSDVWRLFVYRTDDGNVTTRVDTPSGSGTCDASGESVEIDVTAGTVNGERCPHLSFAEGVGAPYDVTYVNADRIEGSYELTVDRSYDQLSSSPHYGDDGSPRVERAIYAANVSVAYRSSHLTYTTELRVAPGESDA